MTKVVPAPRITRGAKHSNRLMVGSLCECGPSRIVPCSARAVPSSLQLPPVDVPVPRADPCVSSLPINGGARPPWWHRLKRGLMSCRRRAYSMRRFVPAMRQRHCLEEMVGPLGYWARLEQFQLGVLRSHGLAPHHALLDLGCGPLQGGIPLIAYLEAGHYAGLDLDPVRIEVGWRRVREHGLLDKEPRLFQSSTYGEQELAGCRFDYIWASQILYYFTDDKLARMFGVMRRLLGPDGVFLGDFYAPDHYEFRYPENRGRYVRHTMESLGPLLAALGLEARLLGRLGDFGYPRRLTMHTNVLLEIRPARTVAGTTRKAALSGGVA